MNRVAVAAVIALAAGGAFALWLGSGGPPPRGPTPEQDALPAPTAPEPRVAAEPEATTGTLVIRLRVEDGSDVPAEARAGYERFGSRRLRPPGADGTFRFTDVPVGPLEVLAETPGRRTVRAPSHLVPGVPTEVILVLPAPAPGEAIPGGMSGGAGGEGGTPPAPAPGGEHVPPPGGDTGPPPGGGR